MGSIPMIGSMEELTEEVEELLDVLFPEDSRLSRETEHRQYGKERGDAAGCSAGIDR